MNRPILACAFFAIASATLSAQDASQSGAYQGVSNPPADDAIITTADQPQPLPKPSPSHPIQAEPAQPAPQAEQPSTQPPPARYETSGREGTDEGIVGVAPESGPVLNSRSSAGFDPDSDIVHPEPLPPGTLAEGTLIRMRLVDGLSSSFSERNEPFHGRVASDVLSNGQVVIPAGAEIDGHVADVSTGHFAGHGSLLLRPENVTLPNGSSFKLHAIVNMAPGSGNHVNSEGAINPGARAKRDGIEYAGVVGGGAITGAAIGGPVGALAGTIVGAGVVTAHLLVSHPQANLDEGSVLVLTLTEQMRLVPEGNTGN